MMDVNLHYELRKQHYEFLLCEAHERRVARELGFTDAIILRSIVTGLWAWLARIVATKVSRHEQTVISRERHA